MQRINAFSEGRNQKLKSQLPNPFSRPLFRPVNGFVCHGHQPRKKELGKKRRRNERRNATQIMSPRISNIYINISQYELNATIFAQLCAQLK